ncbi:MAG: DUF72 domain-containing protein [Acidobacteria bacterium]|nr:DUF72 domain-containing protein [Acidobacteriota bacterium]
MGDIRIGTSGWNYPTGPGTWNGIFYPAKKRGRAFDDLAYYAEHFETVEVNSSFYRLPDPSTALKWARRTPPGFDFSLKLYQKFTHQAMYQKATSPDLPGDGDATAIPTVTRVDVDAFLKAVDPIADAGKLGSLLVQFPPSFRDTEDAREYLVWLLQSFKNYPVAIELRHRSWSDHEPQIVNLLNEHGAAWVQIDEPKFRFSIRQSHLPNLRRLYYMRLHGRNAEQWWTHDHPDDRYNYLYSPGEMDGFAETVATVRRLVQKIYVYLNNHFAGKAVANAAMLRHRLGQPVTGEYSQEMLTRYPFLESVVSHKGAGRLFDGAGPREAMAAGQTAEDAESREG